jgi:serine/threonine-protein kinase
VATRSKIKAERTARLIIIVTTLIVVVVVALILWSLISFIREDWLGGGETVRVPDVVGFTENDAIVQIEEAGLTAQVVERIHNNEQDRGRVFQQSPPPRSTRKKGRRVQLRVSMGPARFVVPELKGKHIDEAPEVLSEAGLSIGKITKIYQPDMEPGTIISQDPAMAKEYPNSIPVDIVVVDNANLPVVQMPQAVGKPLSDAEEIIARNNLQLAKVLHIADEAVDSGTVTAQYLTPEPTADGMGSPVETGKELKLGDRIGVRVAMDPAVMEQEIKTVTVSIPVPLGPAEQKVKIKVYDDLGSSVYYEGTHAAGSRVDQRIPIEGTATIYIFINDMLEPYRVERIEMP